jgi:hypothetical protein
VPWGPSMFKHFKHRFDLDEAVFWMLASLALALVFTLGRLSARW